MLYGVFSPFFYAFFIPPENKSNLEEKYIKYSSKKPQKDRI